MNEPTSLVWLVAAQLVLFAAGWFLTSLALREQRAAAAHWAVFMLLAGVAFAITGQRDDNRTWVAYVGSNLLFVTGFVALQRGIDCFLGAPSRDREHGLSLLLACVLLVAAGPSREHAVWRVLVGYGATTWITLRSMQSSHVPMKAEFGWRLVAVVSLPAVLLVGMSIERLVRQAMDMSHPLELQGPATARLPTLIGYLVGAALFNFSFMGLMVTRLLQRLRRLSRTDPLTGLLNRRALQDRLAQEQLRSRQQGGPLAILALDIDHFKGINDRHGHAVGDAVLVAAAERLMRAARQNDSVARTGGEEFVVLMPATDLPGALAAAERMRRCIDADPIVVEGLTAALPVSVSVGVAVGADDGLMQRADQALYRAKAAGRNRVAC